MSYAGIFTDKNSVDHPVTAVLYGTCATAADVAAKVVTCTDFDTLMTGVTIRVKFTNGNSASSPTININSTGAKSVFRFGSTTPVGDNSWEAGAVVELTYDGTSFFMTGSDDIGALYNALDSKQPKNDNSLATTSKTVVGAINEINGNLSSYEATTNAALALPENTGKNVLPLTVANIKSLNTADVWDGNSTTKKGVTYTLLLDGDVVVGITASGTATSDSILTLVYNVDKNKYTGHILSGCTNGSYSTYFLQYTQVNTPWKSQKQTNDSIQLTAYTDNVNMSVRIVVMNGANVDTTLYPMIRPASITDSTFAPYIPSVEARLETLDSNLSSLDGYVNTRLVGMTGAAYRNNFIDRITSVEAGYYDDNGDLQTSENTGHSNLVACTSGAIYSFAMAYNKYGTDYSLGNARYGFYFWDENKDFISRYTVQYEQSKICTAKSPATAKYFSLQLIVPNSALYVDRQFNLGKSVLVRGEILGTLPDAPTTAGTYHLTCTVVDGNPTYSWVSTT